MTSPFLFRSLFRFSGSIFHVFWRSRPYRRPLRVFSLHAKVFIVFSLVLLWYMAPARLFCICPSCPQLPRSVGCLGSGLLSGVLSSEFSLGCFLLFRIKDLASFFLWASWTYFRRLFSVICLTGRHLSLAYSP